MKKISILILGILLSINTVFATRYVTTTTTTPNYNPSIYNRNTYGLSSARLSDMEYSIFGRTYENQNANARLNRLEKSLFNRTYSMVPYDERMNNLIMQYNNSFQNNYAQVSSRTGKLNNLINNLNGMFYGTPTGITPQVQPYFGYGNNPNWGRQSSYSGRNGWRTFNENIGGGVGIKLLD